MESMHDENFARDGRRGGDNQTHNVPHIFTAVHTVYGNIMYVHACSSCRIHLSSSHLFVNHAREESTGLCPNFTQIRCMGFSRFKTRPLYTEPETNRAINSVHVLLIHFCETYFNPVHWSTVCRFTMCGREKSHAMPTANASCVASVPTRVRTSSDETTTTIGYKWPFDTNEHVHWGHTKCTTHVSNVQ